MEPRPPSSRQRQRKDSHLTTMSPDPFSDEQASSEPHRNAFRNQLTDRTRPSPNGRQGAYPPQNQVYQQRPSFGTDEARAGGFFNYRMNCAAPSLDERNAAPPFHNQIYLPRPGQIFISAADKEREAERSRRWAVDFKRIEDSWRATEAADRGERVTEKQVMRRRVPEPLNLDFENLRSRRAETEREAVRTLAESAGVVVEPEVQETWRQTMAVGTQGVPLSPCAVLRGEYEAFVTQPAPAPEAGEETPSTWRPSPSPPLPPRTPVPRRPKKQRTRNHARSHFPEANLAEAQTVMLTSPSHKTARRMALQHRRNMSNGLLPEEVQDAICECMTREGLSLEDDFDHVAGWERGWRGIRSPPSLQGMERCHLRWVQWPLAEEAAVQRIRSGRRRSKSVGDPVDDGQP